MASNPAKTLSPAELAKLEHAFATEPGSDSYRPLAEAYLGMGRFMEAMVVCKKGVKAHPTSPEPRVLLARVYAEQGKDKKALEELAGALQVAPNDKGVLRYTGAVQMKAGEAEAGKANLLKAYELDPADAETQEALAKWKVEPPKPPKAPEPVPEPEPPTERVPLAAAPQVPLAGPGTRVPATGAHRAAAPQHRSPPAQDSSIVIDEDVPVSRATPPPQPRQPARPANGVQARAHAPAIARGPSQARPAPRSYAPPDEDVDLEDEEPAPRMRRVPAERRKPSAKKFITIGMAVLLPLALGAYLGVGRYMAIRNREFNKDLKDAALQLKKDTYDSYQKACKLADDAVEIHPDSAQAHAYLAYAWAIRWGEHGGGDEARDLAMKHLETAQAGEETSYQVAAEALVKTYSGKGASALSALEEKVRSYDSEGKQSSLLYLTLGIAQMNAGDLERAKDSLDKAQSLAPDDPRVYSAQGALYRRLGQDRLAWQSYDFALRYEKDHPESVLGRSLLILYQEHPEYGIAAKMLKKLIDGDPPPSPRQLATAYAARGLLVSRLSLALPELKPEAQKEALEQTGVPLDKAKAAAEVADLEDKASKLDRLNPDLKLIKSRRLQSEGNVDAAVLELREAIKIDGSRAQFYVELAKVLMQKPGGEREAKDALLTAVKAMGPSPKLLVMLGDAYRKMGKADDAVEQYQRAITDPKAKNPDARLALGDIYRERKDYPKAQELLEKAQQEFVGQPNRVAATYTVLARLHEERGDRQKAAEVYEKALNADVEYAPEYFFYARFLAGDRATAAKAKTTAQEYLRLDPRGEYAADAQRLAQ